MMNTAAPDLTTLHALASTARPSIFCQRRERDKWARLYPVYAELRANGFACKAAVEWLIEHKAMAREDEKRALNAFHILTTRRNKRARQTEE